MYLEYYLKQLNYQNKPAFLQKYLLSPSLNRLKHIGYFCGMDYASKNIYNFTEYITRFDHSLTVSLLVYNLTKDKNMTIAGLFHDISTPCFSHVIDYMNQDFEKQESTEEYTSQILKSDTYLTACLKKDNISINDIINFKQYPIVDNDRPKVCADRIDGVILTGIGWTKNISTADIKEIVNDLEITKNEFNESEIGFKNAKVAKKVLTVSKEIDLYCHSYEDNYMMILLAKITSYAIKKNIITYHDLYTYHEKDLFTLLKKQNNQILNSLLNEFETIKKEDIPSTEIPKLKARKLNPLVNGKRIITMEN